MKKLNPKKLIVFGVGLTPKKSLSTDKMIKDNKLEDTPFFYFEGGTNSKKMGFFGRTIVKLVTKKKVTFEDNTNKDEIKGLIKKISIRFKR